MVYPSAVKKRLNTGILKYTALGHAARNEFIAYFIGYACSST